MNIELKPAGHRYPSVVLTDDELQSILTLIEVEFDWNKKADQEYPCLDTACRKLEMFEDDYQKPK